MLKFMESKQQIKTSLIQFPWVRRNWPATQPWGESRGWPHAGIVQTASWAGKSGGSTCSCAPNCPGNQQEHRAALKRHIQCCPGCILIKVKHWRMLSTVDDRQRMSGYRGEWGRKSPLVSYRLSSPAEAQEGLLLFVFVVLAAVGPHLPREACTAQVRMTMAPPNHQTHPRTNYTLTQKD